MKPLHLTISEDVRDNIELISNKETELWINEYNKFNLTEKLEFIRHIEKMQALYIRYAMENLITPITLTGLGSFFYKAARREFYDIKENNPDLSNDEIVSKVRENYHKRIVSTLTKSVDKPKANVKTEPKYKKINTISIKLKK